MFKTRFSKKVVLLLILDFLSFYAALFATLYLRYGGNPDWPLINTHLLSFSTVFLIWLLILGAFGLYDLKIMKNGQLFFYRLIRAMATNIVLAILVFYIISAFEIEPRRNLLLIATFTTALIAALRYLFNLLIIRTSLTKILFFGITPEAVELSDWLLKNRQFGQKPVAFLSPNGENVTSTPLPTFSNVENLAHIIHDLGVDTIVVLREIKENKILVRALFQIIPRGISVIEFPTFHEALTGKIPLSLIGEVWFLENLVGAKKTSYEFFKRIIDILTALFASIPTLILLPFVSLAIKLDSEGPVFYHQQRIGRHGKEFFVIKYRTMIKDAEKMSGFKEGGPDPRHTRIGRLLRKSYLDELPQIMNILRGEMSFVGPRPERPHYVAELKQKIPFYEMRLLTQPGITGWAQVNMENDASVEDAPEKMQYDLYYVKNRSFALDSVIILRTLRIILQRRGR